MKVLIEMKGLYPGKHAGIENFTYSIIRGFNDYCPNIDIYLSVSSGTAGAFQEVLPGVKVIYLQDQYFDKISKTFSESRLLRSAWHFFISSRIGSWLKHYHRNKWNSFCEAKVDVVLYPTNRLPIVHKNKPVVMVVHDFRWFERLETGSRLQTLLRKGPIAALITAWPDPYAIFCKMFPELVHISFMVPFVMDVSLSDVSTKNTISERALVYTSSNGEEKNHESLIRALGILKNEGATPVRVFCTGPVLSDRASLLNKLIRDEELSDWIFFLGWVPREFVHWLYRNVSGVITTTTYEAMSGTVFEGWQHGKPVACSDISSIRAITDLLKVEVRFFDPLDPQDIANAIKDLFDTPERFIKGSERARSIYANITPKTTALQYRDILAWACGKANKPSWHPYKEWWNS